MLRGLNNRTFETAAAASADVCTTRWLPPFKSMSSCQLWSSQEAEANTICGGLMMATAAFNHLDIFVKNAVLHKYCDKRSDCEAVVKAIKGETGSEMNMQAIKAC